MIVIVKEVIFVMAWTIFEILINCFQGFLIVFYVKHCFPYPRSSRVADSLLFASCSLFLSLSLFTESMSFTQNLIFLFALIHVFSLSAEPKSSSVYWLFILVLVFNLISVMTYPIFDLLPVLFDFNYASVYLKRALCILSTNVLLFVALCLVIRLKKLCTFPRTSAYAIFMAVLCAILVIEESLFSMYLDLDLSEVLAPASSVYNVCFTIFVSYMGLLICVFLSILLYHRVSSDAERENRYQTEISMLSLSQQHQLELTHLYKELTQREHDYKHHIQVLKELVGNHDESTTRDYLKTLIKEDDPDGFFVTGSPVIDALLTTKRKFMRERGIDFEYNPYPLADLPIPISDFCSIVSNLLDNAIEGILRIPEPCGKMTIRLSFSRSWDMFYIYCENPCNPDSIKREKTGFISSKPKSEPGIHGIGLHSIETLAARDEGRTEFVVEDQMFYAKVVLPYLPEKEKSS